MHDTFYSPTSFSLTRAPGVTEEYREPRIGHGLRYEAIEVGRCLRAGLTESPVMPLAETIAIMATMDEVRRQIGVRYPGEVDAPVTDWSLEQLEAYNPQLSTPADLNEFWTATLAEARAATWPTRFQLVDTGLVLVDVYDVTFAGFGGDPVKAWLQLPAGTRSQLPAVVLYEGYGGGRGLSHTVSPWTLAGYAVLRMDTRGQGSAWSPGDTPDPVGSAPAHPGFMTRGILDPATYYYRRVFTDAVLAVDVARAHPFVDAARVAVAGGSQGGGISIAVAALAEDLTAVMPDVPFLCDFPRAVRVAVRDPYPEIARYLKIHRLDVETVFNTLAYFDGAVLGRRATAPALFSVALMDDICPPSTVYAAFHAYGGPKEIRVYPFNDHEGGQMFQEAAALQWAAPYLRGGGSQR